MNRSLIALACTFCLVSGADAEDPAPFPADVPPVIGTAAVTDDAPKRAGDEWAIHLTLPQIAWKVVGEVVPKREWPVVRVDVKKQTLALRMDGPSALAPSRIVDLQGRELNADEVRERLASETPVLVSLSGRMVEPYYLQLTRPDALIVILGPRDGAPSPELLPAPATTPDDN
jgi:hypothetical protein